MAGKGSRDRTKNRREYNDTLDRIRRNSVAREARRVRLANIFEAQAAADKKEKK